MVLLNVFTNEKGDYGTPLLIVEDLRKEISEKKRVEIARKSGFTETVFIESVTDSTIGIYTPEQKIPFASHALIGTYYYLENKYQILVKTITSMNNKIKVFHNDNIFWATADISILPKFNIVEYKDVDIINNFSPNDTKNFEHTLIWSWESKKEGLIKARTFAVDWGIPEDEANGSGSMLLASKLNKNITVFHGKGSIIKAKPVDDKYAAVGGYVKLKA